jgi:hypothetical protein
VVVPNVPGFIRTITNSPLYLHCEQYRHGNATNLWGENITSTIECKVLMLEIYIVTCHKHLMAIQPVSKPVTLKCNLSMASTFSCTFIWLWTVVKPLGETYTGTVCMLLITHMIWIEDMENIIWKSPLYKGNWRSTGSWGVKSW